MKMLLFLLLTVFTNASELSFKTDKVTFVAVSYGNKNVPGPFCGLWKDGLFIPSKVGNIAVKYTWNKDAKGNNILIKKEFTSESGSVMTTNCKVDLSDWSHGFYNKSDRDEIVRSKVLLNYNVYPVSPILNGSLPNGVSMQRHILGFRDGDEVCLIVIRGETLEDVRKVHYYPMFYQWGKSKDILYK